MDAKTIGLYQICFNDQHVESISDGALVWDNRSNPHPEQREFYIFDQIFSRGDFRRFGLCGAVSSKFESKTHLHLAEFKSWANAHPGYDLYFINPYPQIPVMSHDIWGQGEQCHPGIIDITEHILRNVLGVSIDLREFPKIPANLWSYCNFWIASPGFWETYVPLLRRIFEFCASDKNFEYFGDAPHGPAPAPMFSFVIERMLTTVLSLPQSFPEFQKFRFLSYEYDPMYFERQCASDEELALFRSFLIESKKYHDPSMSKGR